MDRPVFESGLFVQIRRKLLRCLVIESFGLTKGSVFSIPNCDNRGAEEELFVSLVMVLK